MSAALRRQYLHKRCPGPSLAKGVLHMRHGRVVEPGGPPFTYRPRLG